MREGLERAHRLFWVLFLLALGLFEGPAQVMLVLLLISTAATGRLRGYRPGILELGLLLWFCVGYVGVLLAEVRPSSEPLTRPLFVLALFVAARGLVGLPDRFVRALGFVLGGAILVNVMYGHLQLVVGATPLDSLLFRNPDSRQIFIPGSTRRAASGLFYNRLKLGHVAALGLGLGLIVLGRRVRGFLGIGVFYLAILASGIWQAHARMGLIAAFAAGLLLLGLQYFPRATSALGAIGLSAAAAGYLWLRPLLEPLSRDLAIRFRIFDRALVLFAEHPILGVGHGMYQRFAMARLGPAETRAWNVDAHNLPLQILTETGVIGAAGFFLACGLALFRLVRAARRPDLAPFGRAQAQYATYAFLVISLLGLVHFPLHHATVGIWFWLALGSALRWNERPPLV